MFQHLAVAVALGGSSLAGAYDLKTTEIPDEISLGMVASGLLINLSWSLAEWNPTYIFQSAAVGSIFFTFGLLMYLGGQWGGGDAKVLTGIGTLVPTLPAFSPAVKLLPFSATFVVNLFMIGAVYMTIYALVFAATRGGVVEDFKQRVVSDKRRIFVLSSLPLIPALIYSTINIDIYLIYFLALIPLFLGFTLLLRFLKSVEETGFEKIVEVEELQVGDMLAEEVEEVDVEHDPTEELKGLSKFLLSFAILPVAMYLFNATETLYFAMSLPGPMLGVVIGGVYLLYSSDLKVFGSVFESSSTRIRGLEKEEIEKIKERREKVSIREGVRFVPAFPAALAFSIYYGSVLALII
ncbi:MAG: prepilin peptidase [Candidatus Aenigmatarchaeota archaeon]